MHGNMVFSRDSIFPTPQQGGCLCVCIVNQYPILIYHISHYLNIPFTTVSPRGHLFYVDFLFFIFTSHRGGNVSTAVRTFPPR